MIYGSNKLLLRCFVLPNFLEAVGSVLRSNRAEACPQVEEVTEEVEDLTVKDSPQPSKSDENEPDAPAAESKKVSTESTETVAPVKESEPSEKDNDEKKPAEK